MRYGKHTKYIFQLGMEKGLLCARIGFCILRFLKNLIFNFFEIFEKNYDDCDDDDFVDDDNYNSL